MKTTNVRKAVFAGSWYPSSASECEQEIKGFLAEGQKITKGQVLADGPSTDLRVTEPLL